MEDNKWMSFEEVLKSASTKEDFKNQSTALVVDDTKNACTLPDKDLESALNKAKELIQINQATDTRQLIDKMRDQFIVNRVNTATATENAVSKTLAKLVNKLETEDMPVNTLLKVLTQLRESSIQDMSAILGAPDPHDPRGGKGTVVNILNNQQQASQPQVQQAPVASQNTEASSDISKFLEITKLATENIRDGKVNVSEDVKNVVDASYEEVKTE